MRPLPFAVLLAGLVAGLAGCVRDEVGDAAVAMLTWQRGTMSELRTRRGEGPFVTYDVPPAEMLEVVAAAARKARGAGGHPVRAIFASALRGEVVAKERGPEAAEDDGYAAPFRSAMLAVVHPVKGRPATSRVEIHVIQRGPFHQGQVAWARDMPVWIDEVLADRAPLAPIP